MYTAYACSCSRHVLPSLKSYRCQSDVASQSSLVFPAVSQSWSWSVTAPSWLWGAGLSSLWASVIKLKSIMFNVWQGERQLQQLLHWSDMSHVSARFVARNVAEAQSVKGRTNGSQSLWYNLLYCIMWRILISICESMSSEVATVEQLRKLYFHRIWILFISQFWSYFLLVL